MRFLLLLLLAQPARADRLSWFPRANEPRLVKKVPPGPLAMTIVGSLLSSSSALLVLFLAPAPQYQQTTLDPMTGVYTTKWVYGRANYMELGIGLSLAFVGWPLAFHGSKKLEDGAFTVRF